LLFLVFTHFKHYAFHTHPSILRKMTGSVYKTAPDVIPFAEKTPLFVEMICGIFSLLLSLHQN